MSTEICPHCHARVKRGAAYCQECGGALHADQSKKILTEVTKQDEFIGYIQITSVIEIALGILIILLGILILIYGLIASKEAFKAEYSQYFVDYLQIILVLFGFLLVFFGISAVYFGMKLFQLKQIGRIGTMLVGALFLIFPPFGTLFGVLALYLLIKPDIVAIFREKSKSQD